MSSKNVGRKPRRSGNYTIKRAEHLFAQSVADGRPDYKYVALAIGAVPGSPPDWAIWACVELRLDEERKAARGNDDDIPAILDDLVRHYDREQRKFEHQSTGGLDTLDTYQPPSLRSAIRHVLKTKGLRTGRESENSDDWIRDIREAWDWEQENDLAPSSLMKLEGFKTREGQERGGLKTTSRVHRVLMQSMAAELGDPEDSATWAWITKRTMDPPKM